MTSRLASLAVMVVTAAGPVAAQSQTGASAPDPAASGTRVTAAMLPVSVERIQKRLGELPRTPTDKLKLEYYIEVYGKAPPLDFFENFDVKSGPVPNAPPTHQDLLNVITPEGFRTPAPNISAFIEWLRRKAAK